ncbi:DMT family transporter [Chromobacterium piscinae]|uniref:DMT family transporter n=1 Tax=Chromobacterium piscinae TaxID=686831 RepID=UPI001E63B1A4|nr:DMT family transporter [Chromobacterium piscinae]MCD4503692.1 DMT family transporter [Chromobacterium piscinae]MCD5328994.1 DMT family transporter [Chromobacterium piscinae]
MLYDLAAVGAAGCWALGGLLGAAPSRHFGPFAFTRLRLTLLTIVLGGVSLLSGGWHTISAASLWPALLSGLAGIFLGDTVMFASMNRLGPRRTGLLFATHSVFSVLLGVLFLAERLSAGAMLGSLLVFGGVLLAVAFGRREVDAHAWERNDKLAAGVALGLAAALCQALGTFFAKPAMAAGLEPVTASALRMGVSCGAHYLLWLSGWKLAKSRGPYTLRMLGQTALNGLVALGLGMTLIMLALQHANVSTVGILSALSPVLILPMLWVVLKRPPPPLAWIGAAVSCAGTALVVVR